MVTNRRSLHSDRGFTLLEIVLVTGIIVVLVATIVPLAMRINVSSKYTVVRQAAAEIGKWGLEWGERNLESQDAADTCVLNDYISTLSNAYVGDPANSNWLNVNNGNITNPVTGITCRNTAPVQYSVAEMIDAARQPRNPFNGLSYFSFNGANGGGTLSSGLLYLALFTEATVPPTDHYYFVFTGTDSANATDWHAGMGSGAPPDIANMRNGVYMTRLVQ